MNSVENLKLIQLRRLLKIFKSSRMQSLNIFRTQEGFLLNLQVGEEFEIQRRFLSGPGPPVSGSFSLLTAPNRYLVLPVHHPWPMTTGHHALGAVCR
jgi:hypothetical protein